MMPASLSFFLLTCAFTLGAMFFSVALVDWPRASLYDRQNFNRRDLLWAAVVACSIGWPIALIYMFPNWPMAAISTAVCILITFELMFPITELKSWPLFQSIPRPAWLILGFFSVLSTWVTLLYFYTEEAQGRVHLGLFPHLFG